MATVFLDGKIFTVPMSGGGVAVPGMRVLPERLHIGYLKDLDYAPDPDDPTGDAGESLLFQYNPEELKRGIQVPWAGQVVPGWSHRRLQFGGGGARTWQFKLRWYLDSDDDSWVYRQTLWLEAQTLAEYDDGGVLVNAPHRLLFNWGDMRHATTVITQCEITYGPLFTPGLYPIQAEAQVTLEEHVLRSNRWAPISTR